MLNYKERWTIIIASYTFKSFSLPIKVLNEVRLSILTLLFSNFILIICFVDTGTII